MPKPLLLPSIGEQINDVVVVNLEHTARGVRCTLRCTICGHVHTVGIRSVREGAATHHRACGRGGRWTEGQPGRMADAKFHRHWTLMRSRTTNPRDPRYPYYGGRGVRSDEFANFVDFKNALYSAYLEAVAKYGATQVSLDRVDPDGDYSTTNCRWVPLSDQGANTRRNRWFLATSPDGVEFVSCNRRTFATNHGLSNGSVNQALLHGAHLRSGWRLRFLADDEVRRLNLHDRLERERRL